MIDAEGNYQIQGIATPREDGGYIVVLDAADISDWLRAEHEGLSDAELDLCHEIADIIDMWAIMVLDDELDVRKEQC